MKLTASMTLALLSISACVSGANAQTAQNAFYEAEPGQQELVTQVGLFKSKSCGCDQPVCGCEAPCVTEPACGCGEVECGCAAQVFEPACGCGEVECGCAAQACEPACGCGEVVCGCGEVACEPACGCAVPDCGCEVAACEPACGCTVPNCGCEVAACEPACGCPMPCDGGCDSGCVIAGALDGCALGECDLGDPYELFGEYSGLTVGGWVSMGYHSENLPLFNSHNDNLNVHQTWLYAEKAVDTSNGFGIGGRIDYVYGTDAQDTQAFGIENNHWDNNWDHGIYGSAIPQLYLEAGYGDWTVKVGHFYTIIGWEVVAAPENFFYSHAYTMYNSEPFTHTGALATISPSDDLTLYGGYVLGWNSGFEDNGDAFLGGVSLGLSDSMTVTYATVAGRFNENNAGGERGYMHSIVADIALSENLQYIFQSDLLDSETRGGMGVRDTVGINNYLIYNVNDCLAYGARFEWYNEDGVFPDSFSGTDHDIYALTLGVNYKPCANAIIRPEIRWDWDDDMVVGLDDGDEQTTFGIDTIVTF